MTASLCSSALSCLQSLDDGVLGTNMTDFTFNAGPTFGFLFPTFFNVALFFFLPLNQEVFSKIFFLRRASKDDSAYL